MPTLDGKTELKIPAGTQHGAIFKLRGKGVPILHSSRRGDQIVTVRVVVPDKLNDKQRKLLPGAGRNVGDGIAGQG